VSREAPDALLADSMALYNELKGNIEDLQVGGWVCMGVGGGG
jgi:hypothetical protein